MAILSQKSTLSKQMSSFEYAVALTGGIATGKSTVAEIFTEYGYDIIDADSVAHDILDEQSSTIAEMFGTQYIDEGRVDRRALGKLIFAHSDHRDRLEQLLHPLIRERISQMADILDEKCRVYLVDTPLFYETSSYPIEDVIVVYAPADIQLARVLSRDGMDIDRARGIIDAQIDIELKRNRAKYTIDNSGDIEQLRVECSRVKEMIDESY